MFGALMRTRFGSLFNSMALGKKGKKAKKRSPIGIFLFALLFIYVAACFMFMIGLFFSQLCELLESANITWFYFALEGIMSFALMFIGSVFMTQMQLYEAKDNELLMSMPIPYGYILASRMLILYLYNFVIGLVVAIPAGAVYIYYFASKTTISGILIYVVLNIIQPMLALVFLCVISFIIAKITSRMRNKSIVTTILAFAFFAAYFWIYSQASRYIQLLAANSGNIAEFIKAAVAPIYWFGAAVAEINFIYMLLYIACVAALFIFVYFLLSKTFLRVALGKKGFTKIKYKEKPLKISSVDMALLKKELQRFVSCTAYIVNCALGIVMLVAAPVLLIIRRDVLNQVVSQMPELVPFLPVFAILAICFLETMTAISAPSISLEAKTIWIIKALPVSPKKVLMSKVNLQLVLTLPAVLISEIIVIFLIKPTFSDTILILTVPVAFELFSSFFGTYINLMFPKFDWVSEAVAVKQSMSVMITMFGTMALLLVLGLLYILLLRIFISVSVYLAACAVILIALCILMYMYFRRGGQRRFLAL